MVQLISAPVAQVEEALVLREVPGDPDRVGIGSRELDRVTPIDRNGVGVEDAALVAADEDLIGIGREGAPEDADRLQELLDRVLGHIAGRLGGRLGPAVGGLAASQSRHGEEHEARSYGTHTWTSVSTSGSRISYPGPGSPIFWGVSVIEDVASVP